MNKRKKLKIMTGVLIVVWLHFLADFVLQNDKMALNKSKSNMWLGLHAFIYMLPFLLFGWKFALINGVLHFIVDYMTSRGTSKLWAAEERHWFFTLIGFDQAVHLTCLFVTLNYMV